MQYAEQKEITRQASRVLTLVADPREAAFAARVKSESRGHYARPL